MSLDLAVGEHHGYTIVRLAEEGYGAAETRSWTGEGHPEWLCRGRESIEEVIVYIDRELRAPPVGAPFAARTQARSKRPYCSWCCSEPCCCAEVAEAERAAIERDAESFAMRHERI